MFNSRGLRAADRSPVSSTINNSGDIPVSTDGNNSSYLKNKPYGFSTPTWAQNTFKSRVKEFEVTPSRGFLTHRNVPENLRQRQVLQKAQESSPPLIKFDETKYRPQRNMQSKQSTKASPILTSNDYNDGRRGVR